MIRKLMIAAIVLLVPATSLVAGDVKLGIGGHAWYVKWEPYWARNSNYQNSWGGLVRSNYFMAVQRSKSSLDPAPLYGPALNLTLPKRFRISTSFLYGKFTGSGKGSGIYGFGYLQFSKKNITNHRYDVDSMISHAFNPYISLFMGFKYTRYDYSIKEQLPQYHSFFGAPLVYFIYETTKKTYNEYAPGLGLGFTIPLVKKRFYLLSSISGIYNFTRYRAHNRSVLAQPIPYFIISPASFSVDGNISRVGCNSTVSLAVLIEKISTTLTVGFRYQFFKLLNTDASETVNRQKYLWDNFYGVTASVMVNIDLTPGKNKSAADDKDGGIE